MVHGAGSSPEVFRGWEANLGGLALAAVDLHAGVDVGRASMDDYCSVVTKAAHDLQRPVALCGWSMGGLVAMMAVRTVGPAALVVLEPSPPAEIQGYAGESPLAEGVFDPEEAYGPFPAGMRKRPESSLARAERKRGISISEIGCPLLVVYGDAFPEERGRKIARRYGGRERYFAAHDHWDLVLDSRVQKVVADFLRQIA